MTFSVFAVLSLFELLWIIVLWFLPPITQDLSSKLSSVVHSVFLFVFLLLSTSFRFLDIILFMGQNCLSATQNFSLPSSNKWSRGTVGNKQSSVAPILICQAPAPTQWWCCDCCLFCMSLWAIKWPRRRSPAQSYTLTSYMGFAYVSQHESCIVNDMNSQG